MFKIPIPTFNKLGPYPEFKDLVNKINTLVGEMQNLMLNMDSVNIFEVGGWLVTSDQLASQDGDVGMSTLDTASDDIRFWAGDLITGIPKFYVTKGGLLHAIDGELIGRFQTKSGSAVLMDVYQNANGGELKLFDISGNLNVKIGSESGAGTNAGGTIIVYNDLPLGGDEQTKQRVALGANAARDSGFLNVKGSNDTVRVQLEGETAVGVFGMIILRDGFEVEQVRVSAGSDSYYLGGDVGFGKSTPVYTVDSSGDINADGVFRSNGFAGFTGTFVAGTQTVTVKGGIITSVV